MTRFMLGILLALFLFVACAEDSSKKLGSATKSSKSTIGGSIHKDTGGEPPPEVRAKRPSQFIYDKTTCNIRSGPGTKYSIIRKATKGQRLKYIALEGNCYKLKAAKEKRREWVHRNVVTLREKSKL